MSVDTKTLAQRRQALIRVSEESAPIISSMGQRLSYNEAGEAVWDMPYDPGFDHALDAIHGGVFATLLDNAGWFTLAPYYDHWISTVDLHVQLLEPASGIDLRATGRPTRIGKRMSTARMEVIEPGTERMLAVGSGTFTVTSAPAVF
ncbi:MAG: PaaI family thioesterase [Gemmatimonadota bacterium]